MGEITDPGTLSKLNATGDDFLKQIAQTHGQGYADMVRATAEGRHAAPTSMAMRTPFGQQLAQDIYQYDPTADDVNLPTRAGARKAFLVGKQGQNYLSIATALEHSAVMDDAITKLGNVHSPLPGTTHLVNGVRNAFRNNDGDTSITQFQNAVTPIIDELERAYTQTGGSVTAIKELREGLNLAQSAAQQRTAVQTFSKLLAGKLEELNKSYNMAMGTVGQTAPGLSPQAQKLITAYTDPHYVEKGLAGVLPKDEDVPPVVGPPGSPPGAPPAAGTPPGTPPAGPAPGPMDGPSSTPTAISVGPTHDEVDPKASAVIDQMIRQGATADQINKAIPGYDPVDAETVTAAQAYLKAHPTYAGSFGRAVKHVENGIVQQAAGTGMGASLVGAANTVSLGVLPKVASAVAATGQRLSGDNRSFGDIYSSDLSTANASRDAVEQAQPLAYLGGSAAGFAGGEGLLKTGLSAIPGVAKVGTRIAGKLSPLLGKGIYGAGANIAADAGYGAAYGAGSTDHLDDLPGNVLTGGAMAAAGGALGRGLVHTGAAVISPMATGAVRRLTDAGVTLTPGQILGANGTLFGKVVKGVEDRLSGYSGVGDVINSTRRAGVADANLAILNSHLAKSGLKLPGDVAAGHVANDAAIKLADKAYSDALKPLSLAPDQTLEDALIATRAKVGGMSADKQKEFGEALKENVEPYLPKAKGDPLTGENLQSIKQGLDGEIALYRKSTTPADRKLADRLQEVRDSYLDLADRGAPAEAAAYRNARATYGGIQTFVDAAAKTKDGIVSPNQYRQAVGKLGYGTTKRGLATNSAPGQDMATDLSTILPSSVPDSGTAGRMALATTANLTGGAALGAGAGYESGYGALPGAVLGGALFSRPGSRVVQFALARSRGRKLTTLGDLLRDNPGMLGSIGSPLLLQRSSQ